MAIKKQSSDGKGSLKQLQILVNKNPELINSQIKEHLNSLSKSKIDWLSPLAEEGYAEYTDDDFIEKIGLDPFEINLKSFWPRRGANWDALAKTNRDEIILVEAKANIAELVSSPSGAGEKSIKIIRESLDKTKKYLNKSNEIDWAGKFYQYTNRIAHLYFLREKSDQNAYLVNIYFVGDETVNGPSTKEEWMGAIEVMNRYLGLNSHLLKKYMADIFIDVNKLNS